MNGLVSSLPLIVGLPLAGALLAAALGRYHRNAPAFGAASAAIPAPVILYASYYLSAKESTTRFFSYLILFMASVLGLVLSESTR